MFRKKEDPKKVESNESEISLDDDLIVHNMPKTNASSSEAEDFSADIKTGLSGSQELIEEGEKDFKKIGALIVSLGIVLLAILIFFSYRFIFKRKADTPITNTDPQQVEEVESIEDEVVELTDLEQPEDEGVIDLEVEVDEEELDEEEDLDIDEEDENLVPIITPGRFDLEDDDGDGLNNEEELLLGTDPSNSDTDFDGHDDLTEVLSGYDPVGPGALSDNLALSKYTDDALGFSFIYPNDWEMQVVNNGYTIIITTTDNSIIQLVIQANAKMQNIMAWYSDVITPGIVSPDRVQVAQDWEGIMSNDNRYFYATDNDKNNIYAFSYEPIISDQVIYPALFQMIINSLKTGISS